MNKPSLQKRDIVIVGLQPWDVDLGSNCKNIALEFSKSNRVLYVNSPLDRKTYLTQGTDEKVRKRIKIVRGQEDGLRKVAHNIWELYPEKIIESINWIRLPWLFDKLNRRNNKTFAGCIERALHKLQFNNIILFNDNDIFRSFHLRELLKSTVSIYYSRDFLLGVDYWSRHGRRLEPKLIAGSDVCVANSSFLARYCKQYNERSYNVGQGCDLSIFIPSDSKQTPSDLKNVTGPVIGYVGALQSIRINIKIIEHIALSRPEWSVVLVGPEDDVFKNSGLHTYKNIFFTGPKELDELPLYIEAFDVCLNPQSLNAVTEGNYPRKIDEYLAMGKPVVATQTEAMQIFANYCYLAINTHDYVELIEKALREDNPELERVRREFASTHTWENSVAEIYGAILDIQQNKDVSNFEN